MVWSEWRHPRESKNTTIMPRPLMLQKYFAEALQVFASLCKCLQHSVLYVRTALLSATSWANCLFFFFCCCWGCCSEMKDLGQCHCASARVCLCVWNSVDVVTLRYKRQSANNIVIMLKLYWFDLLWICCEIFLYNLCTINQQQIEVVYLSF